MFLIFRRIGATPFAVSGGYRSLLAFWIGGATNVPASGGAGFQDNPRFLVDVGSLMR